MLNLKKMKIKKRLTTGFGIVTGITSIVAVLGCIALIVVASRYENALKKYGFAQGDIGNAMVSFSDMRSATRAVIGYDDDTIAQEAIEQHDAHVANFQEEMQIVFESIVSKEEEEVFNKVSSTIQEYWGLEAQVISLGKTGTPEADAAAQKMASEQLDPLYNEVDADLTRLMSIKKAEGDSLSALMRILTFVIAIVIALAILAAIVISGRLGTGIAKGIADPLAALSRRFKTFAAGDLNSPFPTVDTQDEVSEMIQEAKDMAENLNLIIRDAGELLGSMAKGNYAVETGMEDQYVGDFVKLIQAIQTMNSQMNETLRHIDDASNQVSLGSGNLAQAAQALAAGATDQANSVEQLQATMTNITDGVNRTAEQVEESYRQAQQYAAEADRSREEMRAMVSAMERINETSEKIGNIISEIEDIASQTNLLSLNAAIEAARAGEAGRGFAVVADQIRKLAEQSSQSAVDTRELIEGSLQEIAEGNKAAERAAESIEEVVRGVKMLAETSKELSVISNEQALAMEQAEAGVDQISEVVQSNSSTAEQSSATSEELSAQAISMSELVGRFILRDDESI